MRHMQVIASPAKSLRSMAACWEIMRWQRPGVLGLRERPSRRKPRQIARERRSQLDIRNPSKLHEQPFQPDSKPTVWWHAILESLQVRLEWLNGQVRFLECCQVVFIAV